jgi:hypothetical protein
MKANLSPQRWFEQLAKTHTPRFAFDDRTDFTSWKSEAKPAVMGTLGRIPSPADAAPYLLATYEHDGIHTQRWMITLEDDLSAVLVVNLPGPPESCRSLPGILCWAGHTAGGKEAVVGNSSTPELKAIIEQTGTHYGLILAQAGFVTFSIDWMGWGDMSEDRNVSRKIDIDGRDWCNIYYLHASILGMTPLGINLAHGSSAISVMDQLGYMDPNRVGVIGLSGGGTLALWTSLFDDRIRATEIVCYSDSFANFGLKDLNYCGSQITPGLFSLVDLSDLQGLIAPRPLMLDVAAYDTCFYLESATECVARARNIYRAAGREDVFESQLFDSEHGWQDRASRDFFTRHLSAGVGEAP